MRRLCVLIGCFVLLGTPAAASASGASTWYVPGDFATVQEAVDAAEVLPGDRVLIAAGEHAGALLTKRLVLEGAHGAVIDGGPAHPSGLSQGFRLLAGSDGTAFRQLTFDVDLAIMNGAAVDDVDVSWCTFVSPVQGVSNWAGSRWTIAHNEIVDLRSDCGGGIGILIADRFGGVVEGNVVEFNEVHGTLHVAADDCGGYNGTGIVLYADFRWGYPGTAEMRDNLVVHNVVSLDLDDPRLTGDPMDVAAVELTDTRDLGTLDCVIFDNAVGFNDLRGTALQVVLTPAALEDCNTISRNLGEDRGQGAHPAAFKPILD